MIRRQFKEQSCHFRSFCSQDYASIIAQKASTPCVVKPNKVSLKASGKTCVRAVSPSPIFQHRHTFSQNCPTVSESTKTLKPNIKFSWKNQMAQTTKKVGLITDQAEIKQLQLRETKVIKLKQQLMIQSKYTGQQHLSRGSINLNTHDAKFQESLILVDYFHPSEQQMSKIQNYFKAQQ